MEEGRQVVLLSRLCYQAGHLCERWGLDSARSPGRSQGIGGWRVREGGTYSLASAPHWSRTALSARPSNCTGSRETLRQREDIHMPCRTAAASLHLHIAECSGNKWGTNVGQQDATSGMRGARIHISSVAQSCLTLCDPMDCSMPGLPAHHQLLELTQTHVHRAGDARPCCKCFCICLKRDSMA